MLQVGVVIYMALLNILFRPALKQCDRISILKIFILTVLARYYQELLIKQLVFAL